MKNVHTPLLLSLAIALVTPIAWAEKADRNKPMNIEADALRYDDIKQISVFTGKVVITKGTILIRGARVEIRQDAEGHQFGVVTAEPGELAYYRQKREGVDESMEGEAASIEYDGRADRVRFVRKAQLRRFRGATLADEMTGALIVYDNSSDVFTVDGSITPTGSGASIGRVRATLTPRSAASGGAIPTPPAPGAALRQSTTMGGERK